MNVTTIITIAVIIIVFIILFKIFKLIMRLVILAVFLLLAYFTNPDIERHTDAVLRKAEENDITLKGKDIIVDDYYVFSLTNIREDSKKKLIGVGAFTQVFIFSKP